jgi:hypothetical protein
MLGFRPKLPVSDDERQWLDEGFRRLERKLGRQRMVEAQVVLPTARNTFPMPTTLRQQARKSFFSVYASTWM